ELYFDTENTLCVDFSGMTDSDGLTLVTSQFGNFEIELKNLTDWLSSSTLPSGISWSTENKRLSITKSALIYDVKEASFKTKSTISHTSDSEIVIFANSTRNGFFGVGISSTLAHEQVYFDANRMFAARLNWWYHKIPTFHFETENDLQLKFPDNTVGFTVSSYNGAGHNFSLADFSQALSDLSDIDKNNLWSTENL
ncbi:hypothetical protein, partial [Ligilactobacillus equi]|uniref:hypothetical protein n=1 Tax=Ligilactobacillus equi TaxID=137357 RepID=UPI000555885F